MFPPPLVSFSSKVFNFSWEASKFCYSAGRVALWVATSSATILALPVMFESERAQMEEQQLQQQRQVGHWEKIDICMNDLLTYP